MSTWVLHWLLLEPWHFTTYWASHRKPFWEKACWQTNMKRSSSAARKWTWGENSSHPVRDRKVDYVAIGCPHCSLRQLAELARLLSGKKVNQNVTLWIHTNAAIKGMAKQLGYMEIIERSGAVLTQDLCTILSCPEELGFKNIATNSAKMAFYAPGGNNFNVWYGSVQQCIDAAVSGKWKL